jgi:hypothetical protein
MVSAARKFGLAVALVALAANSCTSGSSKASPNAGTRERGNAHSARAGNSRASDAERSCSRRVPVNRSEFASVRRLQGDRPSGVPMITATWDSSLPRARTSRDLPTS